jgi:hypothetical protein
VAGFFMRGIIGNSRSASFVSNARKKYWMTEQWLDRVVVEQ